MPSNVVAWAAAACTSNASNLALVAAISCLLPFAAMTCSLRSLFSLSCKLANRSFSRSVSSLMAASLLPASRSMVSLLSARIASLRAFCAAICSFLSASLCALDFAAFAAFTSATRFSSDNSSTRRAEALSNKA